LYLKGGNKLKKSQLFLMSFALILSAFSNVPGQTGQAAPKSALLYEVTGNDLKKPSYRKKY